MTLLINPLWMKAVVRIHFHQLILELCYITLWIACQKLQPLITLLKHYTFLHGAEIFLHNAENPAVGAGFSFVPRYFRLVAEQALQLLSGIINRARCAAAGPFQKLLRLIAGSLGQIAEVKPGYGGTDPCGHLADDLLDDVGR